MTMPKIYPLALSLCSLYLLILNTSTPCDATSTKVREERNEHDGKKLVSQSVMTLRGAAGMDWCQVESVVNYCRISITGCRWWKHWLSISHRSIRTVVATIKIKIDRCT